MTSRLFGALAVGVGLMAACQPAPNTPPPATEAVVDTVDQIISGFVYRVTSDNILLSTVTGDSAWYSQVSRTYLIKGMQVTFPDSTGRIVSTITSKQGTFRTMDNALDARDSVVGTTPDGKVLRTEHLIWSRANNEIASDTAFTLTSPRDPTLIRGASFTATPDFEQVQVHRVSGRLSRPANPAPAARRPATPARGGG